VDRVSEVVGSIDTDARVELEAFLRKLLATQPQDTGRWLVYKVYLPGSQFRPLFDRQRVVKIALARLLNRPFKLEFIQPHDVKVVVLKEG